MRLLLGEGAPPGASTPHPIRHLKHILRHQIEHPTQLPPRLGETTPLSTNDSTFLSSSGSGLLATNDSAFLSSSGSGLLSSNRSGLFSTNDSAFLLANRTFLSSSGSGLLSSNRSGLFSTNDSAFLSSNRSGLFSTNGSWPGVERAGPPVLNICYTTNEVLVIIGVTCFLNFAFILLIMSCVHFFSTRANRLKSAVLVAENGEEYYYEDFQESDEEGDEGSEWKLSLDKTFDKDNKIDLLQYINNLP
ncbi:hypothetical protein M8J76_013482 [Diaphorina citri]|nr:hypothetical protein M8J75_012286 [Diaphorina citri]KAI5723966.1 hypothetical protein M8J76_013482 [Diaphorina citri]